LGQEKYEIAKQCIRVQLNFCDQTPMSTLSIHGDVHIPDHLIHALGLKPGVELAFERQGDAIVIRPLVANKISRVEDGPNILAYKGAKVTLEEMDAAIAKGATQSL
jgi:bifunctional DNA-binding transcriptional regulator/antitoxin component of YhaV-PrlF toxin-antitoxin module